jgi:hypothetical protein
MRFEINKISRRGILILLIFSALIIQTDDVFNALDPVSYILLPLLYTAIFILLLIWVDDSDRVIQSISNTALLILLHNIIAIILIRPIFYTLSPVSNILIPLLVSAYFFLVYSIVEG